MGGCINHTTMEINNQTVFDEQIQKGNLRKYNTTTIKQQHRTNNCEKLGL